MLNWLSANLVNLALIAVLTLIVAFLIRGMIRGKKAGKISTKTDLADNQQQ